MNKFFTKIASVALGLAMAVGVGVAVANHAEVKGVKADAATMAPGENGSACTVNGNDGIKVGTSKKGGDMTITVGSGATSLSFYAAAWKGVSGLSLNLTMTVGSATTTSFALTADSGVSNSSPFTLSGTESSYLFTTDLSSVTSESVITLASSTTKRFVVWNATYEAASLSSITLGGTYDTEFTIGDTFNHEGMTVTANYSDSTTADKTSSATWSSPDMSTAGQKTVTVSYTEGEITKTADYSITVSAPSTPFITPAKSSTSGYTGQNESLSFTYGNLTGSLSVTSSNTSVVTVETPSTSAGSGTVQINFVAEGSTTVKFNDGSTELASVSVSVSDPTVTITGMPSARSIATGATLNLGSLITVTPTGDLSSDVTWSSSNSGFASVTQSGVVTGEAVGSATITVTPDDYPAGAVSCTVTVANVMTAVFGTTGSDSSTEVTDGSKYKTDYSYTIDTNITLSDISKVYPQTSNALKFGSSSVVGSMTFSIPSTIDSKSVYITSVTVRAVRYSETKGTTMLIGGVEKELTYSADDYTADLSSSEGTSFVLTADSSSSDKRMFVQSVSIEYAFKKTLSSIALSGSYQTTFTKSDTFNHDGLVVTATYSDSSTADVTGSATFSGYDMNNVGNQTVTVSYSDSYGSASTTYQITINYAAVTSVVLDSNSAEIGLNSTFDHTQVVVTVNPSTANPSVEWIVSANTVNDDYVFDASGLLSGDTEGTITLRCRSTEDNTKYDELVVTVSGDPTASFDLDEISGFVGKSSTANFTYGNILDANVDKIAVTSSNTSIVTVANDMLASEGVGIVTINFIAAGSATLSINYNGGSSLDTVSVVVNDDYVTSVTWSASNFDVFSGATLTSDIDNTWLVSYETAAGDEGLLSYGEYDLKLGGNVITLPHTWSSNDDEKTLCVEYGGVSSSSVSVAVTQTINAVNASLTSAWSHEITEKAWSTSGDATLSEKTWTMSGTDDGTGYMGYDGTKGQQFGSGSHPYSDIKISSTDFSETIESVTVYTSGANSISATVQVSVGGTAYGDAQSISSTNTDYTFDLGGKSGEISIDYVNSSSKAIYIKQIVVNTVSGYQNIANSSDHKDAQRVAVKFALAFNEAMDDTAYCTTGLDNAWTACQTAYNTFKTEAAALGETEEAYAKNLIKYATAQYSDDSGEACIERMMKTYEICVKTHGKTAFMDELKPLGAYINSNPLGIINAQTANTAIIVVVSALVAAAAVGGYFYFRRKKED